MGEDRNQARKLSKMGSHSSKSGRRWSYPLGEKGRGSLFLGWGTDEGSLLRVMRPSFGDRSEEKCPYPRDIDVDNLLYPE